MAVAHPYIHFNGNCEEAFQHYREVFGGEFSMIARYSESPGAQHVSSGDDNKIMHISLPLSNGSMLLGSDIPSAFPQAKMGSNYFVSIHTNNADEARKIYDGLAAGGQVYMPLDKTFWTELFGMLADKYGIQWMISYEA